MKIKADLLTVDFENNTITFEVDNAFWKKVDVRGGREKSTIDSTNFVFKGELKPNSINIKAIK